MKFKLSLFILFFVYINCFSQETAIKLLNIKSLDTISRILDIDKKILKKKIDICFKDKRPRLVEAVNRMVNDSIVNNKSLIEELES